MKALIFAAGRGERMRPLSDHTAKPLLAAGGKRLIEWQIEALRAAGIVDLVINTAHLAQQIESTLGDGSRFGVRIRWSREGNLAADALETLGGIVQALPLLGDQPFVAVSGDIVAEFDYERLATPAQAIATGADDAHLVLVDNPPYHPRGDAMGVRDGRVQRDAPPLTYANIAVLAPRLFAGLPRGKAKLFPWLFQSIEAGRVSGEHFRGAWHNVGTPADLAALDAQLDGGTGPRAADTPHESR
jgi:N-acetyl-alpha-D-muramate 1-phosphate uridylyltransferase